MCYDVIVLQILDIQEECVKALNLMASNNRFNKDKMYEMNVPQALSRYGHLTVLYNIVY